MLLYQKAFTLSNSELTLKISTPFTNKIKYDKIIELSCFGRLAQLVRASRLHREGREFESLTAHQCAIDG